MTTPDPNRGAGGSPARPRPRLSPRRVRRLIRTGIVVIVLVVVAVTIVSSGQRLLTRLRPASCEILGVAGGWFGFEPERLANAATISALAVKRGLPSRAAVIGVATAMQESKLQNLRHGDRDSLGLFQQRPSQGWGTAQQVLDPVYATNTFYDRLVKVPGYLTRPLTQVAQAVQLSGFPDAYGRHEGEATALVEALTGIRSAAVTCRLQPVTVSRSVAQLAGDLRDQWGVTARSAGAGAQFAATDPAEAAGGAGITVATGAVSADQAWGIGSWAVAHAERHGIDRVSVGRFEWTRGMGPDSSRWQEASPTAPDTEVRIRLTRPPGSLPPS